MVERYSYYNVKRTASVSGFPVTRSYTGLQRSTSLNRSESVPIIDTDRLSLYLPSYRPYGVWKYRKDVDIYNYYWWDRNYSMNPNYWPYYYRYSPYQRYYSSSDPAYQTWYYPKFSYYPRYRYYYTTANYLDPFYYRRYSDPYYGGSLSRPYLSYLYENRDLDRAVDLLKHKQISSDTLHRYWLSPYSTWY